MSLGTIILQSYDGEVVVEIDSDGELIVGEAARDALNYDTLATSLGEDASQAGDFMVKYQENLPDSRRAALLMLLPSPRAAHKFAVLCIEHALSVIAPGWEGTSSLFSPGSLIGKVIFFTRVIRSNLFDSMYVIALRLAMTDIESIKSRISFLPSEGSHDKLLYAVEYVIRSVHMLETHGKLDLPISGEPNSTLRALEYAAGAIGREAATRYSEDLQRSGQWEGFVDKNNLSDVFIDAMDAELKFQFKSLVAYIQDYQRGIL